MKAIEFVKMMNEETQGNTDISAGAWHMMKQIAEHYEHCPECRDAYDEMEYDDEDLLEMATRIEADYELAHWICEEVA